MSGGNCPETPRQKMIGMMYLFLTAMLALNVSSDLLNAFILVDESIRDTIETVENKNKALYSSFKSAFDLNPTKVESSWKLAQEIEREANLLFNKIQDYKIEIVKTADGPEGDPAHVLAKDNQDIAAQIMLTEKAGERGKDFKASVEKYREFLLSLIDEKDPSFKESIKRMLGTANKEEDAGSVPWQNTVFEHLPLSASLALMSKIQSDVRNTEADVVRYLFSRLDEKSFKFNKVTPIIIPTSTYILKGGEYEAQIMMAAYDDTQDPTIIVNGNKLDIVDGKGILKLSGNSVGDYTWKGEIQMYNPDGTPRVEPITGSYQVAQPNVVISATKMNVFYDGVQNPVEISVPGIASDKLQVTMSNATYKTKGNEYIVSPRPGSAGRQCKISVSAKFESGIKSLGSMDFRIKKVPNPVATIAGKQEGTIKKNRFIAEAGVFAEMGEDFDFDLKFKITRFTISTIKNGYIVEETSKSNRFTDAQKDLLKGLSLGTKVFVENIKAVGPDNVPRSLSSLTFKID